MIGDLIRECDPKKWMKWHNHFCLLPTCVNGKIIWLKTVYRKGTYKPYLWDCGPVWSWEYKWGVPLQR